MTDFSKLDAADAWMGRVQHATGHAARLAGGVDAWLSDPANRVARERAARLLVRSMKRRDREVLALGAAGVPEVVTRIRRNAVRARALVRSPRPSARASR